MTLASIELPKPKNWQDFESHIRVLFECILGDASTQLNGRSGQSQNGVDVFGYRNEKTDYIVGVQCKKKLDGKVTEKELRNEVNKAKNFKPKISEFILVTTAPRDQKIQRVVREITEELVETKHPIKVCVWGWEDIEEQASRYKKAWKAFDPTFNPFVEEGLNETKQSIEEVKDLIKDQRLNTNVSSPTKINSDKNNEDTPLHGKITAYQQLIEEENVNIALSQFLKLKEKEWVNANDFEKYRILVGIASAKLKLGKQKEAGKLLLDAYNENPEHKNAQKNQAAGYLLIGKDENSKNLSYELMSKNEDDAYSASIFIQSKINDEECENPLDKVSESLHESEEVLVAYTHFLRIRNNLKWVDYAKKAYIKYPDNKTIERVYAESILYEFINSDRDTIVGGISKEINYSEYIKAAEILYLRTKELLESDLSLLLETVNNAALALRLIDDNKRAKEILDASLIKFPDNENLLLQRAIIAYIENDFEGALDLLETDSSNHEIISLKATIYSELGKFEDALLFAEKIKGEDLPEHIKLEVLKIYVKAYIEEDEISTAIEMIKEKIDSEPQNFMYRILLIRTYRNIEEIDRALEVLDEAVTFVEESTNLYSRLELSMEAQILGKDAIVIDLLKGKVATDHDNQGLKLLLETAIESRYWITAREIFDSVSSSLKTKQWFLKAEIFFSVRTGYKNPDDMLSNYFKEYPSDIDMILLRIGNWQSKGRNIEIRRFLESLKLGEINGRPEKRLRLATIVSYYEDVLRGLKYAYTLLMDNWSNFKVHLVYQSLVLLNNDLEEKVLFTDTVSEKTVVCILSEGKEKRYRIDNNKYIHFENERIDPDEDLAKIIYGKNEGDEFKLNNSINSKKLKIKWIKSIYLDAFHMSLEHFNERFPKAEGLQRFTFDMKS